MQSGGSDPEILAQMHDLQAEADTLEQIQVKQEHKNRKKSEWLDVHAYIQYSLHPKTSIFMHMYTCLCLLDDFKEDCFFPVSARVVFTKTLFVTSVQFSWLAMVHFIATIATNKVANLFSNY